jgi:hypothetical protein
MSRALVNALAVHASRRSAYVLFSSPSHHSTVEQVIRERRPLPLAVTPLTMRETSIALHAFGFERSTKQESMRRRQHLLVWLFLTGPSDELSISLVGNSSQYVGFLREGTLAESHSVPTRGRKRGRPPVLRAADGVVRPTLSPILQKAGLAQSLEELRRRIDREPPLELDVFDAPLEDERAVVDALEGLVTGTLSVLHVLEQTEEKATGVTMKARLQLERYGPATIAYLRDICSAFSSSSGPDKGRARIAAFDIASTNCNGTQECLRATAAHKDLTAQVVTTCLGNYRRYSQEVALRALTTRLPGSKEYTKPRLSAALEKASIGSKELKEEDIRDVLDSLATTVAWSDIGGASSRHQQELRHELLRIAYDREAAVYNNYFERSQTEAAHWNRLYSTAPLPKWRQATSSSAAPSSSAAAASSSPSASSALGALVPEGGAGAANGKSQASKPAGSAVDSVNDTAFLAIYQDKATSLALDHAPLLGTEDDQVRRLTLAAGRVFTPIRIADEDSEAYGPIKALAAGQPVTARFGAFPATSNRPLFRGLDRLLPPSAFLDTLTEELGAGEQPGPAIDAEKLLPEAIVDAVKAVAPQLGLPEAEVARLAEQSSEYKSYKEHLMVASVHEASFFDPRTTAGFGTHGTDAFGLHPGAAGTHFYTEKGKEVFKVSEPFSLPSAGSSKASSSAAAALGPTIVASLPPRPWPEARSYKKIKSAASSKEHEGAGDATASAIDVEQHDQLEPEATSANSAVKDGAFSAAAEAQPGTLQRGLPSRAFFPTSDEATFLVSHSAPVYVPGDAKGTRAKRIDSRAAVWNCIHALHGFQPDVLLVPFGQDQLETDSLGFQNWTPTDCFRAIVEASFACPSARVALLQEAANPPFRAGKAALLGSLAGSVGVDVIAEVQAKGEMLPWARGSSGNVRVPGAFDGLLAAARASKPMVSSSSSSSSSSAAAMVVDDPAAGATLDKERVKALCFNHLMNNLVAAAEASSSGRTSSSASSSSAGAGGDPHSEDDSDEDIVEDLIGYQHFNLEDSCFRPKPNELYQPDFRTDQDERTDAAVNGERESDSDSDAGDSDVEPDGKGETDVNPSGTAKCKFCTRVFSVATPNDKTRLWNHQIYLHNGPDAVLCNKGCGGYYSSRGTKDSVYAHQKACDGAQADAPTATQTSAAHDEASAASTASGSAGATSLSASKQARQAAMAAKLTMTHDDFEWLDDPSGKTAPAPSALPMGGKRGRGRPPGSKNGKHRAHFDALGAASSAADGESAGAAGLSQPAHASSSPSAAAVAAGTSAGDSISFSSASEACAFLLEQPNKGEAVEVAVAALIAKTAKAMVVKAQGPPPSDMTDPAHSERTARFHRSFKTAAILYLMKDLRPELERARVARLQSVKAGSERLPEAPLEQSNKSELDTDPVAVAQNDEASKGAISAAHRAISKAAGMVVLGRSPTTEELKRISCVLYAFIPLASGSASSSSSAASGASASAPNSDAFFYLASLNEKGDLEFTLGSRVNEVGADGDFHVRKLLWSKEAHDKASATLPPDRSLPPFVAERLNPVILGSASADDAGLLGLDFCKLVFEGAAPFVLGPTGTAIRNAAATNASLLIKGQRRYGNATAIQALLKTLGVTTASSAQQPSGSSSVLQQVGQKRKASTLEEVEQRLAAVKRRRLTSSPSSSSSNDDAHKDLGSLAAIEERLARAKVALEACKADGGKAATALTETTAAHTQLSALVAQCGESLVPAVGHLAAAIKVAKANNGTASAAIATAEGEVAAAVAALEAALDAAEIAPTSNEDLS